ncbi:glycosyltransferase family 2 protein [Rhabdobacter roseus]|uniref:Glycosyltransferase involved in cell wall biosynthesis n=1 Tax=Rhabdobacter roseus TaxID=1655419 RepID=A0A840TPK3_9BACT|nr:glycosyltransferase involved in cell wall biosynthesis [Rhabdobacter roseus]
MKVSIITVVYNGASSIRQCIESVVRQDYNNIEYIIIDGQSTDETLATVYEYQESIHTIISEPDRGIYDAMNKGIQRATGDVIGMLNADDRYTDTSVISDIVAALRSSQAEAVYGDLVYVHPSDPSQATRTWISGAYRSASFLWGWMPPHPAFFLKKKWYDQYGTFRLDLGSSADYELMLRMLYKHKLSPVYLPRVLVQMSTGGVSNSTLSNRIQANKNDRKAWRVNSLKPYFFTLWLKPIRKIVQFFPLAKKLTNDSFQPFTN